MRKLFSTLFVAGLLVAGASAQDPLFRFFFDIEGTGVADHASHRPGDHNLSFGNPELPAGGGRLYLYGEFQAADQTILSPNFDIAIDGGIITEAWNFNGPGQSTLFPEPRWDIARPNPAVNPGGNRVSFRAADLQRLGLENDPIHDMFDIQHDNTRDFGETMLGYVDVETNQAFASVWLTVGIQTFAILGGTPLSPVAFGYGDDPVRAGDPGIRSQIADATIIPEPACVVLMLTSLLLVRGSRAHKRRAP